MNVVGRIGDKLQIQANKSTEGVSVNILIDSSKSIRLE